MDRLKPHQRERVRQFIELTKSTEQTATNCLNKNKWKVFDAVEKYEQNKLYYHCSYTPEAIENLFSKYANDQNPSKMSSAGVLQFLSDIDVSEGSILLLRFAWKCRASNQCEFSQEEFTRGLTELGTAALDMIKPKLESLSFELQDRNAFMDLYTYTFGYAKDPSQRGMGLETALFYWRLLLPDRFVYLDLWLKYIRENLKYDVNKDVWTHLVAFADEITIGMDDYDPEGAWPVLYDDFVAWFKANKYPQVKKPEAEKPDENATKANLKNNLSGDF